MVSKYDVTLPGDGPLILPDPGEHAEPVSTKAGESTLTGGPAASPAEPPAPAPTAPPKTPASPPRRFREEDPEQVARIARRAREELDQQIEDYRTHLFRGDKGFSTDGLMELARRAPGENETLFEIGDDGRVTPANEIVADVAPTDQYIVNLPELTAEQGEWNVALLQPVINDLHDQGVPDTDVSATLKMLTGEPSVSSPEEGAAALRKELGPEKAAELGHVTEWFFSPPTGIISPSIVGWLEERGWLCDPAFLKSVYEHARPRFEAEQKAHTLMRDPNGPYHSLNDGVRRAAVAEVNELLGKARGRRSLF